MEKVESFRLDHNKVKAPFVRKCSVLEGVLGDKVSKFDLRFLQPNQEAFGTAAMHGLEHLLATYLREELEGIIDISPMGCRTGFYLIVWGDIDAATVKEGLERALVKVVAAKEMIAATAVECGNYKDLSLFGAQEYAKAVLAKGFSLNIYGD